MTLYVHIYLQSTDSFGSICCSWNYHHPKLFLLIDYNFLGWYPPYWNYLFQQLVLKTWLKDFVGESVGESVGPWLSVGRGKLMCEWLTNNNIRADQVTWVLNRILWAGFRWREIWKINEKGQDKGSGSDGLQRLEHDGRDSVYKRVH